MKNRFAVKIPGGYLVIEETGTEDEYPGVIIGFSKDGKNYDTHDIVASVEYDTCAEEIRTDVYSKCSHEPISIIRYEDGKDLL